MEITGETRVSASVPIMVGHRVRQARERQPSMTMEQLGQELGEYLGKPWSRQQVYQAEIGRRAFTATEILALAAILEVPVYSFFIVSEGHETVTFPSGKSLGVRQTRALALGGHAGVVGGDKAEEMMPLLEELSDKAREEVATAMTSLDSAKDRLHWIMYAIRGRVEKTEQEEE